jgi:hypothetical protein
MRWKRIHFFLLAAILLLAGGTALSQGPADFTLDWSVIGGGGGDSSAAAYRVEGTIGQSLAHSQSSGSSYRVQGGFWPPFGGVDAPPLPGSSLFLPFVVR